MVIAATVPSIACGISETLSAVAALLVTVLVGAAAFRGLLGEAWSDGHPCQTACKPRNIVDGSRTVLSGANDE